MLAGVIVLCSCHNASLHPGYKWVVATKCWVTCQHPIQDKLRQCGPVWPDCGFCFTYLYVAGTMTLHPLMEGVRLWEVSVSGGSTVIKFNVPGFDWLTFAVGGGWVGSPLHAPLYLMEIFFPSKQDVLCNSQWFGKVMPFDPQTGFSWSGHDSIHTQAAILSSTIHSWPTRHRTLIHGSKNAM